MGGQGSGRLGYYDAKLTVNDYRAIDIRKWSRDDLLTPGTAFTSKWIRNGEIVSSIKVLISTTSATFSYRYQSSYEYKDANYSVDIEWTPCNLQGKRPWFRCPARNCGKRIAILYGGTIFACRNCHKLAYPSQRENHGDRAARKAEKIRERLKWMPGILNGQALKPKGMHWKTFRRICILHNELVNASLKAASLRFGVNMFNL